MLGRMKVDEWQDRTTHAKRKGTKIVVATLDRVRPYSFANARPPANPMVRCPHILQVWGIGI